MGKIFDALEKSEQKAVNASALALKTKKKNFSPKRSEKVLPLAKSNRDFKQGQLDPKLVVYHEPKSVEADAFKSLRSNILFPSSRKRIKSILITSALPDDGKSFVSANLAISIAQGIEEYVLLVDGDIRKPDIHARFGFNNVQGLSEFIAKGGNIGDMLLKTPIKKLTILPAGKPPANPSELLSSKKMRVLLDEVKNRYDDRFILIDSPPPSMASETKALSQHVDGVLLVVRANKTPKAAVEDTIAQIGKEKVIGVVFNQADQSASKYYGYSKSYY